MGRITVVGLGPGDAGFVTQRTATLISTSRCVRFRTVVHPAAADFGDVVSYDHLYETADSFDELYCAIVDDLVRLAEDVEDVVYVVPGSPLVAERTVEMLRERNILLQVEPAVSVIDVACAALGIDPMASGLRIVDALSGYDAIRDGAAVLILQTYSPEILATVSDWLGDVEVTILHHLGLADEQVVTTSASLASRFAADHLTSLYVAPRRTVSSAIADLVDFMHVLRTDCPWDQEQTHGSLARHLLEESYEALDALTNLATADDGDGATDALIEHVEEELGDLLFQIVFHAELGSEDERFTLATIADAVRDKLTFRHPHVFGDVSVTSSDEVAARWEVLKQQEKGRASVTEGVAWDLPALALYAKLLRKREAVGGGSLDPEAARERALGALTSLRLDDELAADADANVAPAPAWGDLLESLAALARYAGIDAEAVLRTRALQLRDEILANEGREAPRAG